MRIAWASAAALAACKALEASKTTRSRAPKEASAFSRSADLRWNASSIGFLNASHSFCSCRRSIGTACACACQRCCKALTASIRNTAASPNNLASSTMAWRSFKLLDCMDSSGSAAWEIAAFHKGCNSAKAFSPKWPASRQRSPNWCRMRLKPFQSSSKAVRFASAHALTSSISAKRCLRCSMASALIFSSHDSTTLYASLHASSKHFHRAWFGKPPWSVCFHCSRMVRSMSCIFRPPMAWPSGRLSKPSALISNSSRS